MSQNIDSADNYYINCYINEVVDKEFEFIVKYQIVPLAFEFIGRNNISVPLTGNSTVFPDNDCCDVDKLKDYLTHEVVDTGFSFCDLSTNGTLRIIKVVKKVLDEVERGPEGADKIRLYLESLSGINKKSFYTVFPSKKDLIIELLTNDILLDHNYRIANIELSSIIDPMVRPEISKYINEVVRNNIGFISKYKVIPLITIDKHFCVIYLPVEAGYNENFIISVFDRVKSTIDRSSLIIKSIIGFIRYIEKLDVLNKFIGQMDGRNSIEIETAGGKCNKSRGYLSLMHSLMCSYIAGIKVVDIRPERRK